MILGEYDARQAYEAFDAQLKRSNAVPEETVLTLERGYSNKFHKNGGNASSSAMAMTLREVYGSDVLVAPEYRFTGSTIKADYTEKMASCMVMPNSLEAWQCEMTGAELKAYLKLSVEGADSCFTPFNRGSLPTVSGISIEVREKDGSYTLTRVLKDRKDLKDEETFRVTCLNPGVYMTPVLNQGNWTFEKKAVRVKNTWTEYIKNGGQLAAPEHYIDLHQSGR